MDESMSFASWLKARRRARDLTQAELADQVGCTTATIKKIEQDQRRPSKEIAERLAEALGLPLAERAAFVQSARGHRAADRLAVVPPPGQGVPAGARHRRSNLSVQRTRLIGRAREVAQLRALLLRDDVGLVTLTGPGGTGKTRLGAHVAAEFHDAFPDGIFVVELASITDPGLLLATIASTLQVGDRGGQPLLETLQDYLRPKQLLLVLDNFEQIVAAAAVVGELLRASAHLKVVATSRIGLRIAGEQEYPVPPLAVPDLRRLPPLEQLTQYAAVTLFLERVTAVTPGFAVTTVNAPAVAEICVRLDGLPLAIELAAARVKILAPEDLLQRLTQTVPGRLTVLTGGARDLPVRQQTLRNTIDWSYRLLDADEQRLLARLAVFMRGCTLAAVEAVCPAEDARAMEVVDGLQSLVETCLLRQEEGTGSGPRFGMLETIHEYARERLEAGGEAETIQQRHAGYYLALVERAEPELEGAHLSAWFQRLEAEHDNLRAALAWSCRSPGTTELSLRLSGALYGFWSKHNHLTEARAWLERALAQRGGSPAARTKALFSLAQIFDHAHEHAQAMALYAELLAIFQAADDHLGIARVLLNQGRTLYLESDYEHARRLEEESLARFQELGDRGGVFMALISLGQVALAQGEPAQARARFEAARRLGYETGLKLRIAVATMFLARTEHAAGDDEAASRLLAESLVLFHLGDDRRWAGAIVQGQAWTAHRQGDDRWAKRLYHASLTLLRAAGAQADMLECLTEFAATIAATGHAELAARLFGAAAATRAALGIALPAGSQVQYRCDVTAARAQLNEAGWDAAWAEGQALTLEQAVAYALAVDPMAAEPTRLPSTVSVTDRASLTDVTAGAAGRASLTPREREVLRIVAEGATDQEAATRLGLRPRTVTTYLTRIYAKLDVRTRTAAVRVAREQHVL